MLRDHPTLPLLSITKEAGIGGDVLYPAGHYASAGESVSAIGTPAGARMYRHPWAMKRERVLFRGRPNTHTLSRYALSYLAQDGSYAERAALDVGLVF